MIIQQDKVYITSSGYLTEVGVVQLNTILGTATGSLDNLSFKVSYKQGM